MPMKPMSCKIKGHFAIQESDSIINGTKQMKKTLGHMKWSGETSQNRRFQMQKQLLLLISEN